MLKTFLKENRSWILLPAAVILLNLGTFWLYRMEVEPFIYGTVLSGVVCVLVIGLRFRKFVNGCRKREQVISSVKPDARTSLASILKYFWEKRRAARRGTTEKCFDASKSSASAGTAVPGGAGGHGGLLHEMGPSD